MLHSNHVRSSIYTESYLRAFQFAEQLGDIAKKLKLDPRGIKVRDKGYLITNNLGYADAAVSWEEGPEDWAYFVDVHDTRTVCHSVLCGTEVSFYDK